MCGLVATGRVRVVICIAKKKYLKLRHPDHKVLPHATLLKLKSDKFWKVVLKFEVSGSGGYWSLKCTRHLNNKISISGKQVG